MIHNMAHHLNHNSSNHFCRALHVAKKPSKKIAAKMVTTSINTVNPFKIFYHDHIILIFYFQLGLIGRST